MAIAVSKSPLIPMLSCVDPGVARQLRHHAQNRAPAARRRAECTSGRRRRAHARRGSARRRPPPRPARSPPSAPRRPILTWTNTGSSPPRPRHLGPQHAGELVAVDRLDDVEQRHRLARLVGLQRPDEVQFDVRDTRPAAPATCPAPPAPGSRRRPAARPRGTAASRRRRRS